MSIYIGIISSAVLSAFFLGVYIKTGVDASPSGIFLQITTLLEPYMPSNLNTPIEYMKLLLAASPWIGGVISILKAPHKIAGLILYVVVFVIMIGIISSRAI